MAESFCLFSALYKPSVGGVEKYTENLATALAAQGHHVVVVTENAFGKPSHEIDRNGVELVRLPARGALGGRYPLPTKRNERQRLIERFAGSADYVVVNTRFYPLSLQGLAFASSHGIRPILIEHGSAHLTLGSPLLDPAVEVVEHAMARKTRTYQPAYYGVSEEAMRWLSHFGIQGDGVLPNAIDADAFLAQASPRPWRGELGIEPDDFLVTFTGRLIPEKGIAHLVEAATRLAGNPHVKFAIAGSGPLEDQVRRKLPSNAQLVGPLTSPDVASLLQASDAYCLPTRSEGFSTSLLEAAAAGVAPIMPRVGGVAELMPDERYGMTLPSTDAAAIAHAIAELEGHRERARTLGSAIAQRVRNRYSWKATAEAVAAACERAQAEA